jgi:Arc/MetJ-type ribon-helix-helix transcriptional regulator
MQQTKYRAQILLEPEQHTALAEIAQSENRSISDLVREILRQWLEMQGDRQIWDQRMDALDRLTQIRERIQGQYGVYEGDLLGEARLERDEDMDRVWRGEA